MITNGQGLRGTANDQENNQEDCSRFTKAQLEYFGSALMKLSSPLLSAVELKATSDQEDVDEITERALVRCDWLSEEQRKQRRRRHCHKQRRVTDRRP